MSERLLAHGVKIPPGAGLTRSLTLPHAVELAAYTLLQQPANTLADQLSLRFAGRTREQTEPFGFLFTQIHGRLTHALYMVPYLIRPNFVIAMHGFVRTTRRYTSPSGPDPLPEKS